jgi:hypothetical protein
MNKHIAKFNGTTFTRNSKDRTYTHVIVVRESYEYALERAKKECSSDRENYKYHMTIGSELDGRGDQVAGLTEDEYVAQKIAKQVAAVEAAKAKGDFDSYGQVGWCGRPDLAQKKLSSESGKPHWAEVHAVEVTIL